MSVSPAAGTGTAPEQATPTPHTLWPQLIKTPNTQTIPSPTQQPLAFSSGVDISWLQEIEANGGLFYDQGEPQDALTIFKRYGVDTIRLRLWVNPVHGYCNTEYTLEMARRVKAAGFRLMLDFHYSDTWADPAHQQKPAAWQDLPFDQLAKAVHDYTLEVMQRLKQQDTLPDSVQIGNEISSGFLWPDGAVGGSHEANWPQFATLLKAGIAGVNDSLLPGEKVRVILHIDAGGNNAVARWFFDHIQAEGVAYDIIGLSYYPWWHGTLEALSANITDLRARYSRPVWVVETAYPWTLSSYSGGTQVSDPAKLLSAFPATQQGQRDFLAAEQQVIRAAGGSGMFYWEPDFIPVPMHDSGWGNLGLFDNRGIALPALSALAIQ